MQKGFTIIEVLVVSVVMTTLGFAILGLQFLFSQNETTAFNTFSNVNDSSRVISEFSQEVRKAQNSDNGSFAFETLGDNEIVFYSDVDFDGSAERVRYTVSGEIVTKGVTQPSGIPAVYDTATENAVDIITSAKNNTIPVFYYYNKDWPTDVVNNPLPSASRLSGTQLISIFLVVNNKENNNREDYGSETFVQPRILKNNL